jgi:hypothetical protein
LAWPGAVVEMVDPGALDDVPRGGAAPLVPVSGGVQAGSLPEFDCDPPPVPLGGLTDPVPVPLGGAVDPVGAVVEPAPAPPDELDVPVAVRDAGDALGDAGADRVAVLAGSWVAWSAGSVAPRAPAGGFATTGSGWVTRAGLDDPPPVSGSAGSGANPTMPVASAASHPARRRPSVAPSRRTA